MTAHNFLISCIISWSVTCFLPYISASGSPTDKSQQNQNMRVRWVFISSFLSCPVVWEISIQMGPCITLETWGCLFLLVVDFLISIHLAYGRHNGWLWLVEPVTVSSRKNGSRITLDSTPHQTLWVLANSLLLPYELENSHGISKQS